jgi:glutaconyl-CoA/methylmalonyl-CoA decarboxylase subunit delta
MNLNFISIDLTNIDSNAIIITVVGYTVVFLLLASMVMILNQLHRIRDHISNVKNRKKNNTEMPEKVVQKMSGDENAAICTALYLYFTELHDEEKYVMTVKKVSKTYSPWSSKIYGVMNNLKSGF